MTTEYKLKLRLALIEERRKLRGATGTMDDNVAVKPSECQTSDT